MAELAVRAGQHQQSEIIDTIGPETYTFNDLLRLIASAIHSRTLIVHTNPKLALD
jgi:NADH dehydrogenase